MKKLLLLTAILVFACSSDDNSSSDSELIGENISKIKIKRLNSSQSDCSENDATQYGLEREYIFYYSNGEVTSLILNDVSLSCETNEILTESFEAQDIQSQLGFIYETLQYQNSHLIYISLEQDNDNYNNDQNYEWVDGNLTKIYSTNDECCYYYILEYSDFPNNTKYEFGFFFEGTYNYLNGVFRDEHRGITSTNLPSSITYIERSSEDGTLLYDSLDQFYGYEFNNEGNPVKFLIDSFFSNYSPNSVNEIINQYSHTYQVEIEYTN